MNDTTLILDRLAEIEALQRKTLAAIDTLHAGLTQIVLTTRNAHTQETHTAHT